MSLLQIHDRERLLLPAAFRREVGTRGFEERMTDLLIRGFDQGFNERADLITQTVDGTDLNQMWRDITDTLRLQNDWRDNLLSRIMFRVTNEVDTVGVPMYAAFEKASEYGQPVGYRGAQKRHRGYTFEWFDLAFRYTWMFLAEATRADLDNHHNMALEADNRLIFTEMLRTLFNPTNLVGVADGNIPVNVYKLWNADGEVPPPWKSFTHSGSHTHFLTLTTAVTSASLGTMADHLAHHGNGVQDGATLVLLVNQQEANIISTFKVSTGAAFDFIPSQNYGGGVFLPANGGVIARPGGNVREEIGTYGPWHVVREDMVPANYLIGLASGGPFNINNPVGFREHKNAQMRGLKAIPGQRSEYPLIDSFYQRGFGVGVRQRGAGVILNVNQAGAYAPPAAYVQSTP
jgi:hypothetical protein